MSRQVHLRVIEMARCNNVRTLIKNSAHKESSPRGTALCKSEDMSNID